MVKKEIHAWIDEDLYYWLREYARSYLEQGYRNWFGMAVEDAVRVLMESVNSRVSITLHNTQNSSHGYMSNKLTERMKVSRAQWKTVAPKRIQSRIKCILSRIEGRKSILYYELINIIFECAGTDYRTVGKYLDILQNLFGLRFHEKNECLIYIDPDEYLNNEIPVKRISFFENPIKALHLMKKCTPKDTSPSQ